MAIDSTIHKRASQLDDMIIEKYVEFLRTLKNIEMEINTGDFDNQVKTSLLNIIGEVKAKILNEICSMERQDNICLKALATCVKT
ncbi:MAG: hypothetical protein QXP02_05540 [Desulfurococcaceae archaeon]